MRGRIPVWLFIMKIQHYIPNKVTANSVIRGLAKLDECGPGSALLILAAEVEKKITADLADNPGFNLSEPKKHALYMSGMLAGIRLLTVDAPASAKESIRNME